MTVPRYSSSVLEGRILVNIRPKSALLTNFSEYFSLEMASIFLTERRATW